MIKFSSKGHYFNIFYLPYMFSLYIDNLKKTIWFSLKCGYSDIVRITLKYKNDIYYLRF